MPLFYVSYSSSLLESPDKLPCVFTSLKQAREFAREKADDRMVVLIFKDGSRRGDLIEVFKDRKHYDKNGHLITN